MRARRTKAIVQRDATWHALRSEVELASVDVAYARRFQSRDETLFSRFSIAESAIDADLGEARLDAALARADTREQQLASGLTLADIEGRKAELTITQTRAGLAAVTVTAPRDGILVLERDWRGEVTPAGQTAWPGDKLAEIPDLARLQMQVWVLEADAGGLAVGQAVRVRLDANPEQEVAARVARLEAVAKPRQRGSPVHYFARCSNCKGRHPHAATEVTGPRHPHPRPARGGAGDSPAGGVQRGGRARRVGQARPTAAAAPRRPRAAIGSPDGADQRAGDTSKAHP